MTGPTRPGGRPGPTPAEAELSALRLVSQGEITIADGGYVHDRHPVSGELAAALVRLHATGCLVVGRPGPGGHRPVRTTAAGAARLRERNTRHE